ncbi:MAG: TonB-dependent hemoglobin/transferrin/lactoferrin family receptor [Spongiibacteraceae bacterium]
MKYEVTSALLLLSVVLATPLHAQTDENDIALSTQDATVLKQINVTDTATKTPRDAFDIPDSVSIVNFTEMENRQVRNLGDAIKDLPGVSIGGGPRALAQQPEIRGLSGNRILITVDGARQNFNSGHKGRVFVDPELLKQIDVLRGPGSAVWGSGALGGVIAMTTKDARDFLLPDQTWGARLRASGQSGDGEILGTGTLFGQLNNGAIDLMLSGTRANADDIRLGGGDTLENSGSDLFSNLAKISWAPSDNQRLKISRQYQFVAGEIPAQADAETSVTAVLTDRETEVDNTVVNYTYDSPTQRWLNVYFNAYRNDQVIREKRIGTNGRLDTIDFTTDGVELRNTSYLGNAGDNITHQLTYGIEYFRDRESAQQGGTANAQFPDASANFLGVFLQDQIEFNDSPIGNWLLVPGLRLDDYRSESDDTNTSGVASDTHESQWSPRLGAVYKLNAQTHLTANYSRAFRAPNFQDLYISGAHFGSNDFIPNPDLKPERGESIEIGARHRRPSLWNNDDKLTLSGSIYFNRYRDFIETIVTPIATTNVNTTRARIYGAEGEMTYRVSPLQLDLGLSFTVARGDDETGGDPLTTIAGDKLVFDASRCFDRCIFSLSWRSSLHRRQNRVADGQPETAGYSVHDINLIWRPLFSAFDDVQIAFGISNLTDHYYREHLATLPAAGRSVNMSGSVQF